MTDLGVVHVIVSSGIHRKNNMQFYFNYYSSNVCICEEGVTSRTPGGLSGPILCPLESLLETASARVQVGTEADQIA